MYAVVINIAIEPLETNLPPAPNSGDPRPLSPGAAGFARQAAALETDGVDVLLAGESSEWEMAEYAADAVSQGRKKALILIGHVPSEQAGMEDCAQWLKTFMHGVPIEFLATQQPFWTTAERPSAR